MSIFAPLLPSLKGGPNAAGSNAPSGYPGYFHTQRGKLRIPRNEDPPGPTQEMIRQVRQGHLTDFFQKGIIFPAAELIGDVSAQTAKISLDHNYDFQSRQLFDFPPTPESEKSLRNLYYIALELDELPSFHFWTGPGDPNPEIEQHENAADRELGSSNFFSGPAAEGSENPKGKFSFSEKQTEVPGGDQDRMTWPNWDTQKTSLDEDAAVSPFSFGKFTKPTDFIPDLAPVQPALGVLSQGGSATHEGSYVAKSQTSKMSSEKATTSGVQESAISTTPPPDRKASRKQSFFDLSAKPKGDEPKKTYDFLRCDRGGMYLYNFDSTAFKDLVVHLIKHEENDETVGSGQRYIDILKPGQAYWTPHLIETGRKFQQMYRRFVEPFLGIEDHLFRVRSDAYNESTPWDNGRDGTLKVTRLDVGYCSINAVGSWTASNIDRKTNNEQLKTALDFLFKPDEKKGGNEEETEEGDNGVKVTLQIRQVQASYDIDRSAEMMLSQELGEVLKEITNKKMVQSSPFERMPCRYSAEIYVHKTGEDFVDPLTARVESSLEEDEEAEKQDSLEQQEAQEGNVTAPMAQQSRSSHWNTSGPEAVSDFSSLPRALSVHHLSQADQGNQTTSELEYLRGEVDNLKRQVTFLQDRIRQAEQRALRAEENVSNQSEQCQGLWNLQGDLEQQVQAANQARDAIVRTSQALESVTAGLEGNVIQLRADHDHLQSRVSGLENKSAEEGEEPKGHELVGKDSHESTSAAPNPFSQDTVHPVSDAAHGAADPKKLLYCVACLKSVDKLDDNVKSKHAQKCNATVSSFQHFTMQEAKEMRTRTKAPNTAKAPTVSGKERAVDTDNHASRNPVAGPSDDTKDATEDDHIHQGESQARRNPSRNLKRKNSSDDTSESASRRQKTKTRR